MSISFIVFKKRRGGGGGAFDAPPSPPQSRDDKKKPSLNKVKIAVREAKATSLIWRPQLSIHVHFFPVICGLPIRVYETERSSGINRVWVLGSAILAKLQSIHKSYRALFAEFRVF